MKPQAKKLALLLLVNSVALIALYFFLAKVFPYIWILYAAAGAGLGFYYIIYNKGFAGKGITPDMLPDTMSLAEKQAFIEDSRTRLQKSKWVLTVLLPILFTFAIDMFYLFCLPYLENIFL